MTKIKGVNMMTHAVCTYPTWGIYLPFWMALETTEGVEAPEEGKLVEITVIIPMK